MNKKQKDALLRELFDIPKDVKIDSLGYSHGFAKLFRESKKDAIE